MPQIAELRANGIPSISKYGILIGAFRKITAGILLESLPVLFDGLLILEGRKKPVIRLQRHPLIIRFFPDLYQD